MRKHLLILTTILLGFIATSKAQNYANTAIDSPDGRVKTTYEIQGDTLYYHVHVVLPDELVPDINNGWDQENQAQFGLYIPNHGYVGSFEYCFTTETYFTGSDSNVQHTSDGNVHDFIMAFDVFRLFESGLG